ncbi:hypothetical protein BGAL_0176g00090 [Botrytis galanthina]|uniref:2EXR domain-containing protein n=1 Tax=Botrytis galanthina TaxID=278940 RepID=A0A4S8QXX4_9HELO|nr:hypothetical protein BGAL_0176g00090 [Botrytis galanthina]
MDSQDQSSDQAPAQDQSSNGQASTQDQSSNIQAPAQNQSPDNRPPVKFTLFPQLPVDIRVTIWKATLIPRLLSRRSQPLNPIYVPSLPGVNAEARGEALRVYLNIAISPEHLHNLRLSRKISNPKGDRITVFFNPEIDVVFDDSLRCDVYPMSNNDQFNANTPSRSPLLINPDFVKKIQVSTNVFLNSFWNWEHTSWNWRYNYYAFEEMNLDVYGPLVNRMGFTYLHFNNLNEFIVQDFDCAFPHRLDSPDMRARCREFLGTIFKAETTRESKAHIKVSIPKIVIRQGAKVGICDHCIVLFTPWTKWPLEQPFTSY